MGYYNTTGLAEEWLAAAELEFQQMDSVFWPFLSSKVVSIEGKKKWHYEQVSKNVQALATSKPRYGAMNRTYLETSEIVFAPTLIGISIPLDEFDLFQRSDLRDQIISTAKSSIQRGIDDKCITAANASANAVTLPTATTWDMKGIGAANTLLTRNDVSETGRILVTDPKGRETLGNDQTLINNYFANNTFATTGVLPNAQGLKVVTSNRLLNGAGGSTQRRTYVFHPDAFKIAVNKPLTVEMYRLDQEKTWNVDIYMSFDVQIVQPKGVAYADILI